MALQFLKSESALRSVYSVIIADRARVASAALVHGGLHGDNYAAAVAMIRDMGFPRGPIARLLGINGSAALSYRNGTEYREEMVQGTADPNLFSIDGRSFQILHVFLVKTGFTLRNPFFLTIFAKSQKTLSARGAADLARKFTEITGCRTNVWVRQDTWFLDKWEYPYVFPFANPMPSGVPSKDEYSLSPNIGCGVTERGVRCAGHSFAP